MTEQELIEKYPIFNEAVFEFTKRSILNIDDEYDDDRAFCIDIFDQFSDEDGDDFFYEMLRCVKYSNNGGSVAYTTPDRVITLCYPNAIVPLDGKRFMKWYFIYCHECLHQLWDTFEVEQRITEKFEYCDRQLLNVASDCVINDYLMAINNSHKLVPDNLITPEVLKLKYNVDYDRKIDTQFTLYQKLIDINDEKLQNDLRNNYGNEDDDNVDDNTNDNNQNQNNDQETDQSSSPKMSNNNSKSDKTSDDQETDQSSSTSNKSDDTESNSQSDNKSDNKQTDDSNDDSTDDSGNSNDTNNSSSEDQTQNSSGQSKNDRSNLTDAELINEIRHFADSTIEKYANSISGKIGNFIKKCKSSAKCENPNFVAKTDSGGGSKWINDLEQTCVTYIKNKLKGKKEYKRTYSKVKRGTRPFTNADMERGRLIQKGKRIKKDKVGFDISVYIDASGSMGDLINKAFDIMYKMCDNFIQTFSKEKQVDPENVNIKIYSFTTHMKEIPYGKRCPAAGGTYDFDELLNDIYTNGKYSFLNIVITDAEFEINNNNAIKLLNDMEGLFAVVTNTDEKEMFNSLITACRRAMGANKLEVYYTTDTFD